jgi:hypothetical protein
VVVYYFFLVGTKNYSSVLLFDHCMCGCEGRVVGLFVISVSMVASKSGYDVVKCHNIKYDLKY